MNISAPSNAEEFSELHRPPLSLCMRYAPGLIGDMIVVRRLSKLPEVEANHLWRVECPTYDDTPALAGNPVSERRLAIISTAGLRTTARRSVSPDSTCAPVLAQYSIRS